MNPDPRKRAFTLLELLVAMTITLLLAGIMLNVTTGALGIWRRTQDNQASGTAAKLALDMIERDLQSALHRDDGPSSAWLAADVLTVPAALASHGWLLAPRMKPQTAESQRLVPAPINSEPADIKDARFGLSGVWLRFIAATAESDSEPAVPRAISYQIARRPVSGAIATTNEADVRYTLFRTFLGGQATFSSGYDVVTGYGGALANPSTGSDALAPNVVDFGVWLYVRESSGALRRIYPTDNSDLSHVAADPGRYPEVADVMVRVLTNEGARLLDVLEKSSGAVTRPATYASDAEWWWALVEANSRVFVYRVEIKGGTR